MRCGFQCLLKSLWTSTSGSEVWGTVFFPRNCLSDQNILRELPERATQVSTATFSWAQAAFSGATFWPPRSFQLGELVVSRESFGEGQSLQMDPLVLMSGSSERLSLESPSHFRGSVARFGAPLKRLARGTQLRVPSGKLTVRY